MINTEEETKRWLQGHERFSLNLVCTDHSDIMVNAYKTDTPGLAIHTRLYWSPEEDKYREDPTRWQVTHIPSGRALLTPGRTFERVQDALALASALSSVATWTMLEGKEIGNHNHVLVEHVYHHWLKVMETFRHDVGDDQDQQIAYFVNHNRETGSFEIVHRDSEEVVEEVTHRGTAWDRAHTLTHGRPR